MTNINDLKLKIQNWANDRNLIDGSTPHAQMLKLTEELGELAAGIARKDRGLIKDAIGDCFVVITILCAQLEVEMQGCIEAAYNEIKDRKGKLVNGVFIKDEL